MRITVIVLAIFLFFNTGNAQDTTYQNSHIMLKGFRAKLNGGKLSASELKTEIYKVSSAIPDYKKYKTNLALAYGSGALAIGSLFLPQKEEFLMYIKFKGRI